MEAIGPGSQPTFRPLWAAPIHCSQTFRLWSTMSWSAKRCLIVHFVSQRLHSVMVRMWVKSSQTIWIFRTLWENLVFGVTFLKTPLVWFDWDFIWRQCKTCVIKSVIFLTCLFVLTYIINGPCSIPNCNYRESRFQHTFILPVVQSN